MGSAKRASQMHTKGAFGLRFFASVYVWLFFWWPAPSALFMGHEQCIKEYEQYLRVNNNFFVFIVFSFKQNKRYSNVY